MSDLNLRFFTAPNILNHITESDLKALLDPHRSALFELGFTYDNDHDIDRSQLARMLDHAGESYPDAFAHTLSLLHEMDNDHAHERLYACYRLHDLSFSIDEELTPFLFALRIYLHAPDVFKDEHAHAAIPHVSTYAYYQTSLLADECVREKPTDAQLHAWTDDLNNWMIANQKGAGTRMVCCQEDNTFFFVIQHGGHMKCENVMKKGTCSSLMYRPAVTDVLSYNLYTGEIGMNLSGGGKRAVEKYKSCLQSYLIGPQTSIVQLAKYQLQPLLTDVNEAMQCADIPQIQTVELVHISLREENGRTTSYSDVLVGQALEETIYAAKEIPCLLQAQFKITLRNGIQRKVSVSNGHKAKYQRDEHAQWIELFLERRGYLCAISAQQKQEAASCA